MAGIERNLRGSTLIETLVAAVVLLIVFTLTMETLAHLSVEEGEPAEWVEIVKAVQACYRQEVRGEGGKIKEYGWGKIEVRTVPYGPGLWQETLTVVPRRGKSGFVFVYLK